MISTLETQTETIHELQSLLDTVTGASDTHADASRDEGERVPSTHKGSTYLSGEEMTL